MLFVAAMRKLILDKIYFSFEQSMPEAKELVSTDIASGGAGQFETLVGVPIEESFS